MIQSLRNGFIFLVFFELLAVCGTLSEAKEFRITENPSLSLTTKGRIDVAFARQISDQYPINCSLATDVKAQTVSLESGYDSVGMETSGQQQPSQGRICRNTENSDHISSSTYDDNDEKNNDNDDEEEKENDDDDNDDDQKVKNYRIEKTTETESDETWISLPDYDSNYPSSSSLDNDKSNDYKYLDNGNYDEVYSDKDDNEDGGDDVQERNNLNDGKRKEDLQEKIGEKKQFDEEEDEENKEEEDDDDEAAVQVQSSLEILTNNKNNSAEDLNNSTTPTELSYLDVNFDYDYNKQEDEAESELSSMESNRNSPAEAPVEGALQISRNSSSSSIIWTTENATVGEITVSDRGQGHLYHVFSLAWLEDEDFVSNFTIYVWLVAAFVFVAMTTALYRYRRFVTSLVDFVRCGHRQRTGISSHETINGVHEESNNLLAHVQV